MHIQMCYIVVFIVLIYKCKDKGAFVLYLCAIILRYICNITKVNVLNSFNRNTNVNRSYYSSISSFAQFVGFKFFLFFLRESHICSRILFCFQIHE